MIVNENKDMPVDSHDDHLVHIALHQEAFGRGNDELLQKHMDIHNIYLAQGPISPETATAPDDAMRNQQVAGQQPPTPMTSNLPRGIGTLGTARNPVGMGGMGNPPSGMGGVLVS